MERERESAMRLCLGVLRPLNSFWLQRGLFAYDRESGEKEKVAGGCTGRPITINICSLIQIPGDHLRIVTPTASIFDLFSWWACVPKSDNASTGMHLPINHAER